MNPSAEMLVKVELDGGPGPALATVDFAPGKDSRAPECFRVSVFC